MLHISGDAGGANTKTYGNQPIIICYQNRMYFLASPLAHGDMVFSTWTRMAKRTKFGQTAHTHDIVSA